MSAFTDKVYQFTISHFLVYICPPQILPLNPYCPLFDVLLCRRKRHIEPGGDVGECLAVDFIWQSVQEELTMGGHLAYLGWNLHAFGIPLKTMFAFKSATGAI